MKAVAGVLSFEAGELEVFGIQIDSERAAERIKSRLGFMPQGLGSHACEPHGMLSYGSLRIDPPDLHRLGNTLNGQDLRCGTQIDVFFLGHMQDMLKAANQNLT